MRSLDLPSDDRLLRRNGSQYDEGIGSCRIQNKKNIQSTLAYLPNKCRPIRVCHDKVVLCGPPLNAAEWVRVSREDVKAIRPDMVVKIKERHCLDKFNRTTHSPILKLTSSSPRAISHMPSCPVRPTPRTRVAACPRRTGVRGRK